MLLNIKEVRETCVIGEAHVEILCLCSNCVAVCPKVGQNENNRPNSKTQLSYACPERSVKTLIKCMLLP